jgi:hypothetical protein
MALADERAGDGTGGWTDEGPFNDLRELKTGLRTFYGVPFRIIDASGNGGRGIIVLRGTGATPTLPGAVTGIPIPDGRVRNLYFLHASAWPGQTGDRIGHYVVHYADGSTETIPLETNRTSGNWWQGWTKTEESRPVPVPVKNTPDGQPGWRYLRVLEWQNPRPATAVTGLDFVSASGWATPILLAVTGVR